MRRTRLLRRYVSTPLAEAFEDFRLTRFPAPFPPEISDEAISGVFHADTYLAGLVSTFLGGGQLGVSSIELDTRLDEALADAAQRASGTQVDEVLRYRKKMLDLAHLLSRASGIPIRHAPMG
jgi:hypothetical protein